MTTSRKWICVGSLSLAGLISFFFSGAVSFSLLFNLFPSTSPRIVDFAFFLPVILGFPIYFLAVFVSKRFCLALWLLGLIDYALELHTALRDFHGSHAELMNLMLYTFERSLTMALLIPAALVQFGTHFYKTDFSSFMARMRRKPA